MRSVVRCRALAAAAVVVGLLTGCDGSGATSAPSSPAASHATVSVAVPTVPAPTTSGSSTTGAPATAPRPSPSGPVAPASTVQAVKTLTPVPLASPAAVSGGVVVRVVRSMPITTSGTGIGQSSGEAAVAVTLGIENTSSVPVRLDTATVLLSTGPDRVPARIADGPPARAFPGSVRPGGRVEGVYVFVVPVADREDVLLTVSYAVGKPVVALRGRLP